MSHSSLSKKDLEGTEKDAKWVQRPKAKLSTRIPDLAVDASICGFMMFYGKSSFERRVATKYKCWLNNRILDAFRLRKVLGLYSENQRHYDPANIFFFRVDENNASVRDSDGKPIYYHGIRTTILKTLAMEEIKRYDDVMYVRLMYNSCDRQTKIMVAELGFKDGKFYSKDIKLEALREYISNDTLLIGRP